MQQEKGKEQFHDSESEDDVYDLYNACNGVLDIRRLDDLSQEEAEVLDILRLKELGVHIASGCASCEAIINTLNLARRVLRDSAEEPGQEPVQVGTMARLIHSRNS